MKTQKHTKFIDRSSSFYNQAFSNIISPLSPKLYIKKDKNWKGQQTIESSNSSSISQEQKIQLSQFCFDQELTCYHYFDNFQCTQGQHCLYSHNSMTKQKHNNGQLIFIMDNYIDIICQKPRKYPSFLF